MPRITVQTGAIHQICKDLDISRAELSRRMTVDTGTAYRVEAGKVDPSPRFMAALMKVTGRKFEELFEVVDEDAA